MRELRGLRPDEVDELCDVVQVAFSDGDMGWLREQLATEPGYDWWHTRIARVDGRMVSAVQLLLRRMRCGAAVLPVMGIGNVATLPTEQGQGHASAILREADGLLARQGYVLGLLFTDIPDFYRRLGWEAVEWPFSCYRPVTAGLPATRPAEVRAVTVGELDEAGRAHYEGIYDSFNAGRVGPVVRTPAYWANIYARSRRHGDQVLFAGDAYLQVGGRASNGRLTIEEMGCLPGAEGDMRILLTEAARLAAEQEAVVIGPGPAVAPPAWWKGIGEPATVPAGIPKYPPMFKVLDWPALWQAARPELERRWVAAGRPPVDVTLAMEAQPVRLVSAGGRFDVQVAEGQGERLAVDQRSAVSLFFGAVKGVEETAVLAGQPFHFWGLDEF